MVAPVLIGILPSLLDLGKEPWAKLSFLPPTSRRVENLDKIQDKDATFLSIHPLSNSLIVEASQMTSKGNNNTILINREGRKIEMTGKRIY